MRRLGCLWVALGMLALGACGGKESGSGCVSPERRPATTGQVAIISPVQGDVVKGPRVALQLALQGATILRAPSKCVTPGTGHLHVKVDGETVSNLAGLDHVVEDVKPGLHLIEVELVGADHIPFNPTETARVSITVE